MNYAKKQYATFNSKKISIVQLSFAIFLSCTSIFLLLNVFLISSFLSDITFPSQKAETVSHKCLIPTLKQVKENGYPTNENGESFGPALKDSTDNNPDLVLAKNHDGIVGYIRESEIQGFSINLPSEAENYTPHEHYINMYLEDGVTVIGQFLIDG